MGTITEISLKSCKVYFKESVAFVFTQSVTASGVAITTEPMLKVQSNVPAELGSAVVTCLTASREGVANPEDFSAIAKNMTKFAGEKSWDRFVKGAILRSVWLDGIDARVVPYVAGERGSFSQRPDQSVQCAYDAAEIGRCLIESLSGDK
jgi:hypothetical protein